MEMTQALVATMGMLVGFGLPVLVVAIVLYYKHRRQQLMHETILRLAEKGVPVPAELLQPPRDRNSSLRGGLVLVALGIGLSLFFLERGREWSIGLIPGLMGLALLIAWAIETRSREKDEPPR